MSALALQTLRVYRPKPEFLNLANNMHVLVADAWVCVDDFLILAYTSKVAIVLIGVWRIACSNGDDAPTLDSHLPSCGRGC